MNSVNQNRAEEEGEGHLRVRRRGCICFLGDCLIEEVPLQQRGGELSKELSGEEDRARRRALGW